MAKKKPSKSAKSSRKKNVVANQHLVAQHFKVSIKTVNGWRLRGMPGERGKYDLDEIDTWKKDTIRKNGKSEEEQSEHFKEVNEANKLLVQAQAELAVARAQMAVRQNMLEQGNYAAIDDLNLFLAEFFTELRQLLNKMNVDMAAGFSAKIKNQLRTELQERHDLILRQMHDWTLRTEDIKVQSKGAK